VIFSPTHLVTMTKIITSLQIHVGVAQWLTMLTF
jgi:hypothetical protein